MNSEEYLKVSRGFERACKRTPEGILKASEGVHLGFVSEGQLVRPGGSLPLLNAFNVDLPKLLGGVHARARLRSLCGPLDPQIRQNTTPLKICKLCE